METKNPGNITAIQVIGSIDLWVFIDIDTNHDELIGCGYDPRVPENLFIGMAGGTPIGIKKQHNGFVGRAGLQQASCIIMPLYLCVVPVRG